MNFESWYKKRSHGMTGGDILQIIIWKNAAEQGWNACKDECLKILKENTKHNFTLKDVMKIGEEIKKI